MVYAVTLRSKSQKVKWRCRRARKDSIYEFVTSRHKWGLVVLEAL